MKSRTILVTATRGSIVKNLFHTGIIRALTQNNVRVVLVGPGARHKEFREAFGDKNIFFDELPRARFDVRARFFIALARGLLYNRTTFQIDRYGLYSNRETNILKFIAKAIFFIPLSKVRVLKEWFRALDRICTANRVGIEPLIERWKPDLVFSTNIAESEDADLVRIARQSGVGTVALPKSWDNMSKLFFRAKADRILVWSPFMKEEVMRYQQYRAHEIEIVGPPHFDTYTRAHEVLSKEELFSRIGADPHRALIVFGSEGKVSPEDGAICRMIYEMIRDGELEAPAELFIRPYLAFPKDDEKFVALRGLPHVIIDDSFHPNDIFSDHWDYSWDQFRFMASVMRHMDLMVTNMSTLTLDAAFNAKPVINIAFDGDAEKPYRESMVRWYDSDHYAPVVASRVAWMVRSREELKRALNAYLKNPHVHAREREQFVARFCGPRDGGAAERVAQILLKRAARGE